MTIEKRIYYHDTDAGKVVYYANYLKYLEEGRTEYLESKGIPVKGPDEDGFHYAVRRCNVDYKMPARYGDIIICSTEIEKITAAQIYFKQTITHKKTNHVLVEANVILVSLTKDFKAQAIPAYIKDCLS